MARNIQLGELVMSSLQSQQSLTTVIAALPSCIDFSPFAYELSAFHELLKRLQQVPANMDTEFDKIKDLLQRTSDFCTNTTKDLQEKAQSRSTDWSSLNRQGDDVNSITSKLRMYTSALGVGAMDTVRSTGLVHFDEQDDAKLQELVNDTLTALKKEYQSIEKRFEQKLSEKKEENYQETETE